MKSQMFGLLVAGVVSGMAAAGTASAAGAAAGKCTHSCKGRASCKSAEEKGKNGCAGQGQVPKECSEKTKKADCEAVKDKACTWHA